MTQMRPMALPAMLILGIWNGIPLMHPVYNITLRRAAILRSQLRDLAVVSSKACLLLQHKLNPRPFSYHPCHCKTRLASKTSTRLLGAFQ